LLQFRDPLRQFTRVWSYLLIVPYVLVEEEVHFYACNIVLLQSLS
jgi:hypothetical protein